MRYKHKCSRINQRRTERIECRGYLNEQIERRRNHFSLPLFAFRIGGPKTFARHGDRLFEQMIFPPHCWPRELEAARRSEYRNWLDGEGCRITSFCIPLLDNNPNGTDVLMRKYTLDRYREAVDLAAEWSCPYVVAIPGPVNSLINPPNEWMLDWFVEGMKSLVDHSRNTGVEIILENVPFTYLPTAKGHFGCRQPDRPGYRNQFRCLQFRLYQRRCSGSDQDAWRSDQKRPYFRHRICNF